MEFCIARSLWLGLAIFLCHGVLCSGLECISPSGTPVDWFMMYKLPVDPGNPNRIIADGVGFYYLDANKPSWELSKVAINDTGHAVFNTLKQIYKNTTADYMYAMYNDQPPGHSDSLNHGHTKGAVSFDKTGGFWLIMSIPDFPSERANGYIYPKSGKVYGQSILCVSLDYEYMDIVGKIMTFTYPKFYDKYFPSSYENAAYMNSVLKYRQSHVTTQPWKTESTMRTKGGKVFHNYAKATGFEADLYDDFLGPNTKEDFLVETWQNGAKENKLPSNCSIKFKIFNIQDIHFPDITFKETKDHSKWAVSQSGYWVCIGDINRQRTQFHRGGSTMCVIDANVWKQYSSLVRDFETCGIFDLFG